MLAIWVKISCIINVNPASYIEIFMASQIEICRYNCVYRQIRQLNSWLDAFRCICFFLVIIVCVAVTQWGAHTGILPIYAHSMCGLIYQFADAKKTTDSNWKFYPVLVIYYRACYMCLFHLHSKKCRITWNGMWSVAFIVFVNYNRPCDLLT